MTQVAKAISAVVQVQRMVNTLRTIVQRVNMDDHPDVDTALEELAVTLDCMGTALTIESIRQYTTRMPRAAVIEETLRVADALHEGASVCGVTFEDLETQRAIRGSGPRRGRPKSCAIWRLTPAELQQLKATHRTWAAVAGIYKVSHNTMDRVVRHAGLTRKPRTQEA